MTSTEALSFFFFFFNQTKLKSVFFARACEVMKEDQRYECSLIFLARAVTVI